MFKFRRSVLRVGIALFLLLSIIGVNLFSVGVVHASPTDVYWVGGGANQPGTGTYNWSDATNHWATTSGGTPDVGNMPDLNTNVHFDVNSGFTAGSQFVTLDGNYSCKSIICTGMNFTAYLWQPNGATYNILSIYGDGAFSPHMVIEVILYYYSASGTITNNGGVGLGTGTTIRTGASISLADDMDATIGGLPQSLYIETGATLTTNSHLLNLSSIASLYAYGTLNAGASIITTTVLTYITGAVFNLASSVLNVTSFVDGSGGGGAPTVNCGTSTINCSEDFNGYGLTYYNVNLTGTTTATVKGICTFHHFTIDRSAGAKIVHFTAGTTQTADQFYFPVSGTTVLTMNSTSAGSHWDLHQTSGVVSTDYVSLQDSHASGGALFAAGANSTDVSGNTGWLFIGLITPVVTTGAPTDLLFYTAKLNGTLSVVGSFSPVFVFFQYGLDQSYGTNTVEQPTAIVGSFSQTISGLSTGATYHYRIAVRYNSTFYIYGSDVVFDTSSQYFSANPNSTSNLVPKVNPSSGITTGNAGTNFLGYDLFKGLIDDYNTARPGMPAVTMQYFWRLVAIIIAFLVGTAILVATRQPLFGVIAYFIGFLVPTVWLGGVFDWWVPIIYVIGATALTLLVSKWGASTI